MKKYEKNYFNNIQKENLNKNLPITPCRKSSSIKESNPKNKQNFKINLSNKGQTEKINAKKNYKLYSSSILNKREKIENKNYNMKMKDIKSFSNSREFKNNINGKSVHYNDYNNNFSKNNNKKKADYLYFLENYKIKKTQNKQNNEKNHENQNKINKTQSFVNNNDNLSYNSYNYVTNTAKNAVNSSVKNSQKSHPSSLLLQKKLKEEKRIQNKSKPITLIESSKERRAKSKEKSLSKNKEILIKKNFQINTTNANYYNNSKISNSNFFLKNVDFSNKTCSNDYLYSNDLIRSEKNPIVIKEKISKYNKSTKNKEIKKSQSQSHIFYQKTKSENYLKNNDKKIGKKDNNLSTKKILKNKGTNFNLNINNINNYNNKFLFNCENLNKSESKHNKKSKIAILKYPYQENKKMIFYNDINNYKFDLLNILNNLPEEYTKNELFIKITNLWNELGGINIAYIESFINHTKDNNDKNIIFENEIIELNLIINLLKSINENIKTRNEILLKIKSLYYINSNIISSENLNEIKNLLNLFTKSSIKIIKNYNLFIKEISFDLLLSKYSFDKINNFDINYIFQMETDSNLLFENPVIGKIYSMINNENQEIIEQINSCKCILFKYKIYQDLLSKNENINTDNYFSSESNNNMENNQETNANNNSIKMNQLISKEENLCFIKESNKQNNEKNICKNSENKESEINRNEIIYYPKNFNSFTFGKENKIPKLKDKDISKLVISPYNPNKDPKLVLLYTSYISSINEKMKLSFNINNDIYYYMNRGIYPKVFLFKDLNFNVKGICTLSYEQNVYSDKKILTITNISCMDGYKISKILLNLIEYCRKNHIFFDSIEINLYYIKKEGKFILDGEYENEIKNEAKFKWVKLENDGEKRMIKYHFVNNNNLINNKEIIGKNDISFKSDSTIAGVNLINYTLIKYYQEYGNENIIFSEYSQLYMLINLLKKYYLLNDENDETNQIMENLKGIKLKKIVRILSEYCHLLSTNPKDFKKDFCEDNNFNINILNQLIEKIEKNKDTDEDLLCLNYYNFFTNFSNIIKTEINGYEYNIITMKEYVIEAFNIVDETDESLNENNTNFNIYDNNENMNIYKNCDRAENNSNETLYFIKSEKDGISFIFYELSEDKEISNQKEIETLYNKVLKKILVKDNEEPIKSYNKICIPSFSYKKMNNENEIYEDKTNEKLKIIDYELLYYFDEINFCLENLINNDIKFSFPLSKNVENYEDIKIIKSDFIIAMINPDLVLDYHLPAMNIFYINKSHWIKIHQ